MRIPVFLQEHPVEAFLAGALLLGLLFGGADHSATEVSKGPQGAQIAIAQKL